MRQRIQLKLDTDTELGSFELDLRKAKQIVYNLLANAVKFSASGGVVTLAVRQVPCKPSSAYAKRCASLFSSVVSRLR